MKRIQERFNRDKLQVLLLSVDLGYGFSKEDSARKDKALMQKQNVDWPNVLLPHGFEDVQRRFNIDGYGLTLIGPDGTVRGVDLQPDDVEKLLGKMFTGKQEG